MKIQIKGTGLELTEALKSYAEEKIGSLEHYFINALGARVELDASTHHHTGMFRCEVNLDVPEKYVLRAESLEPDLYAAIDTVVPKLREEIERYKGKQQKKNRRLGRFLKTIFAWRNKNE